MRVRTLFAAAMALAMAACVGGDGGEPPTDPGNVASAPADDTLVGQAPVVAATAVTAVDDGAIWTALVDNPDPMLAIVGTEVEVELLDGAGEVVERSVEFLTVMLPGERAALGGRALDDSAEDVRLTLFPRWAEVPDEVLDVTGELVELDVDASSVRGSGVLSSDFDDPVFGVDVVVVLFDADDQPLGAALEFVPEVPPLSVDTPFTFEVEGLAGAVRAEVYTSF